MPAIPDLETHLRTAADSGCATEARADACWQLSRQQGRRRDPRIVPLLLRLLRDNDPDVVAAAVFNLGLIGGRRAVRPLLRLLTVGPTEELRYAAAMALRDLHEERAIEPLFEVLEDQSEAARVRGQAAEALGSICRWNNAHTERMAQALRDPEPEVRFWAAYALSQFGDPAALPALVAMASDP
ncbi:MAG: lyase domain protein repeat-containing protein, partial [Armatimonadetes bacterium]|nr:lyase domain protein repeat-containing protein [Armatimonadota bacterium]